jgi:hypothetical protein
MYLIYIDESTDEKISVFSALAVSETAWQDTFRLLRHYRGALKKTDGISIHAEFHAWKFVSGRGRISEDGVVTKGRRCAIFSETLGMIAGLPEAFLVNAVYPTGDDEAAFDGLLDGLERVLEARQSHAVLICDAGKDVYYTRLARRRQSFDPNADYHVPYRDGDAADRKSRILEDPFYKDSKQSYFVQLADFCAYALLRRERPLESKTKYGLDRAFARLSPVLALEASADPEGIVRPGSERKDQ